MAITCICPHCRRQLTIADEHAGQPMRCPMCAAMFQAPALYAAQTGAAYSGPAPFWQNQPTTNPAAPEWPWLVGNKPPAGPPGDYEWEKVQNPSSALDPGWHLVRRGLGLIPPGLLVAFTAGAIGLLFLILGSQAVDFVSADTSKVILMLTIPAAVLGSVAVLLGLGLCCAAPKASGARWLGIGAAAGSFVAVTGLLFAVLLSARLPQMEAGFLKGMLSVMMYAGYTAAVVAGLGGGVAFLLFLRGAAEFFGNKRLAQRIFYYLIAFAASPLAALLVFLFFRGMAALLGLDEGAYHIILAFAELALLATVLGGFLLMLRDARATIERVVVPTRN